MPLLFLEMLMMSLSIKTHQKHFLCIGFVAVFNFNILDETQTSRHLR